ncbi:hypothetical protein ABVT39_007116 [Epinephelus coioides]
MDCTPDISHTEQLSIVLRIVNCEPSIGASVSEHFFGFLDVLDTTGKGLCNMLLEKLQKHNLNIAYCRGQSHDSGSNMMGHKQGVQARILQLNNKALCVSCNSHTLNLVIADAAKSLVRSMSLFGVLQRLCTLFSSSMSHWAILKQHVKDFTVKPLLVTRWEARIQSVKALRYQMPEMIQALSALNDVAVEKKDSETMSSAESILREMRTWQFLLCIVVWYNVLYQVNHASKIVQSPTVSIQTVRTELAGVKNYLTDFRESGLAPCQVEAGEIAEVLGIDMRLPEKRIRTTKRQFLYESREETLSTPDELFNQEFFLPLPSAASPPGSQRWRTFTACMVSCSPKRK